MSIILCFALRHAPLGLSWHAPPAFRPQVLPASSPIIFTDYGYSGSVLHFLPPILPAKTPDMLGSCFRFQPDGLASRAMSGETNELQCCLLCCIIRARHLVGEYPSLRLFRSWPINISTCLTANKQPRGHCAPHLISPTAIGQV